MNCKLCFKEEPTHLFRCIIGNTSTDLFLCSECIKKVAGNSEPLGLIGEEIISEDNALGLNEDVVRNMIGMQCSNCGTSLEEVGGLGKFGCESCYELFSDLIATADMKIDEKEKKLREKVGGNFEKTIECGKIEVMKRQMDRAIKMEKYEDAAKIRDEIQQIEKDEKKDGKRDK